MTPNFFDRSVRYNIIMFILTIPKTQNIYRRISPNTLAYLKNAKLKLNGTGEDLRHLAVLGYTRIGVI